MQTTLLGLGVAVILALVAALIAPLVVDWNHYRSAFEAEASRLTGLSVRVNGTIEARILPTPRIKLDDVVVGEAGGEPRLRAASIELEVGLAPLLRGKVEATELRLVAPRISLGLDRTGAVDWPIKAPSFSRDRLAISRFDIEDGRIVLADAASGSRLVVQKLWFSGSIRSLVGPFNGEGAFVAGDDLYGYRVSGNSADTGGGLKLRLGVDSSDRPLTTEIEGTLSLNRGIPRFEGTLALARPAGTTLARGQRVLSDPWRLTGSIRATPVSASLRDLALQYGPDERAVNFNGKAELTFGPHPHLDGSVSGRAVDLDRAIAAPRLTRRPPLVLIKSLLENFAATVKPPLPIAVGIAVDAVTIGGTTIQSLHGSLRCDDRGWGLDGITFRAPGFTKVSLSGRLDSTPQGLAFSGPASIESADLKMLMAWLEGRKQVPSIVAETLTAQGDVTVARDRFAFDRLTATFDREKVEGRLGYAWAAGNRPAVLNGELRAEQLDLDALMPFAKAAASGGSFELPHQVSLALDIGAATFAGVDARNINAKVKFDAGILDIDRLSIGDLGGAALNLSGRIDELSSQPRGRLTLDLDALALGGLERLVGRFAPQAADSFHRFADRLAPAKLHGVLTMDRDATGSVAKLDLDGDVGAMRLALRGDARGEPARPAAAVVRIDGRLDADDGGALARLLGLDGILAVDQLPGQMTITAVGPLDGDLHVDGLAAAGGFSAAVKGVLHLDGAQAPTGRVQVKASAADLRPLHRLMTGQPGAAVPISASATLGIAGTALSFTDVAVAVGKTSLHGRLGLKLSKPISINGDIEADNVDAAAISAMLLGLPSAPSSGRAAWSAEPIGPGVSSVGSGTVTFRFNRAALTPTLFVRDLRGVARLKPSEVALNDLSGSLAGGRLTGELAFRHDGQDFAAQGHIALAGADAAAILGHGENAVDGLLSVKLHGDGIGVSPNGIIDSLHGSGVITLTDGRFAGIDTAAFAAAVHAVRPGGKIEPEKVRAAVTAAMARGRLAVPHAEANVTISNGQMRLTNATLQAQSGADLSVAGALELNGAAINAQITLTGHPTANALIHARPELAIVIKGPLAAPERRIDISALLDWLTLRAAELESRRIESIEANRRPEVIARPARPASPAMRFLPLGTPLDSSGIRTGASTRLPPGTRRFERLRPEHPAAAALNGTRSTRANPGAAAAPLPAAIEIKPNPPPATDATATAGTAEPERPAAPLRPASRPDAPAEGSPFDFLFRPQN